MALAMSYIVILAPLNGICRNLGVRPCLAPRHGHGEWNSKQSPWLDPTTHDSYPAKYLHAYTYLLAVRPCSWVRDSCSLILAVHWDCGLIVEGHGYDPHSIMLIIIWPCCKTINSEQGLCRWMILHLLGKLVFGPCSMRREWSLRLCVITTPSCMVVWLNQTNAYNHETNPRAEPRESNWYLISSYRHSLRQLSFKSIRVILLPLEKYISQLNSLHHFIMPSRDSVQNFFVALAQVFERTRLIHGVFLTA